MVKPGKGFFIPLFLTIFIDFMGIGIVVPIFAPLLLDKMGGLLPIGASLDTRGIVLGFLTGIYALAQFVGAPFFGQLSDRFGRRPLLIITLIGITLAYALSAVGIMANSIVWMFIARAICGFFGGNTSIAQSAVADLTDTASKASYFGYLALAMGLGFTLGPVIGGRLADPGTVSWFTFATPFWFSAILSFINLLLISIFFKETLAEKITTRPSFLNGVRDIKRAFTLPGLRALFAVFFFFVMGWFFFATFFQVYLIQKFDFHQAQIGDTYTYIGLLYAVFQGLLAPPISRRFSARSIVLLSLFLLIGIFPLLLIPNNPNYLYAVYPFIALFVCLAWPNILTIVSNLAPPGRQGEILGLNQAIQSLAQGITPIIAGPLIVHDKRLPTFIATAAMALAWLILLLDWRHLPAKKK